ncbi:hypothetical protein VPHD85_0046 [Vibrio phage D85]|nr:hypothetical protein PODOV033v1_p0032 [Vibrio phage 252E42.2]
MAGKTPIYEPLSAGDEDNWDMPVVNDKQMLGGVKVFNNNKDRDAWAKAFPSRLADTVALVGNGENGYPSWYKWETTWHFAGYFGGMVLADVDGALTRVDSTAVLGPDFKLQAAGDQGNGVLIMLSDKAKADIASKGSDGLITIGTYQSPQTFSKGNTLELEWPLKAWPDADKEKTFRVSMDHSAFEPLHKPGFLAYLSHGVELVGKHQNAGKGHHDGAIWFDEIIVPTNAYIGSDMSSKSYTIEEADNLDPNVSGGTDYLIAFRVGLKGNAPDDGFVRIYIYDKSINPFMENGYMEDVNGQPMIIERHYKQGDKLGFLDIIGVVNAKGQQGFSCHVVDNFVSDTLNLTDPYYGETALMIQTLASDSRTGMARLQYQQDTQQRILEGSRYMGKHLFSVDYYARLDLPMTTASGGNGQTQIDGVHFYNLTYATIGVVDDHIVIKDDGTHICDFSFGNIFDAETTSMLKGRDVTLNIELTNKNGAFRAYLVSWTGEADKYTPEIFTSRDDGSPTWQKDWDEVGNSFIPEDAVHDDTAHSLTFSVPSDAKNFAIIIAPGTAEQPLEVKIKSFNVDVTEPFTAYSVRASEMLGELRGVWNPENFLFTQGVQGYASLRYTINKAWTTMPVGIPNKAQNQDITLDPSKNKIGGSAARGGEGVIKFNKEGLIDESSYVDFLAWNEQGTDNDLTVRVVMLNPDTGKFDPDNKDLYIAEGGITVPANSKGSKHLFHIPEKQVEQGEEWGIFAKSSKDDGAFLECVSDKNPLIQVQIKLKKLDTVSYTLSDEGDGKNSAAVKYDP